MVNLFDLVDGPVQLPQTRRDASRVLLDAPTPSGRVYSSAADPTPAAAAGSIADDSDRWPVPPQYDWQRPPIDPSIFVQPITEVDPDRGRAYTLRGRRFHLPLDPNTGRNDPTLMKGVEFLAYHLPDIGLDPAWSANGQSWNAPKAFQDDPNGAGLLVLNSYGRLATRHGQPRVVSWDELFAFGKAAEFAEKDSWLYRIWDEGAIQIGAGTLEATRNTLALAEDLYRHWQRIPAAKAGAHWTDGLFPDMPPPDTPAGQIARNVSRFFTGFLPILRATKTVTWAKEGAGTAAKIGQWLWSYFAAGAATDFLTADPQGPRLVNQICHRIGVPQIALNDFLEGKVDDTAIEGRIKNAIDGGLVSAATAPLVLGLAWLARTGLQGVRSAKAEFDAVAPSVRKATEIPNSAGDQFPEPNTISTPAPTSRVSPRVPTLDGLSATGELSEKAVRLRANVEKGLTHQRDAVIEFAKSVVRVVEGVAIRPNTAKGPAKFFFRTDGFGREAETAKIGMMEAKASKNAQLSKRQSEGHPLTEQHGGTVIGTRGGSEFPAGTEIPRGTRIRIIRPSDLGKD